MKSQKYSDDGMCDDIGHFYANSPVTGLFQIGSKTEAHRQVWMPFVLSKVL